ncbi:Wzz/FepE/Etk N-terminal domain-containing protein [Streptococcus suis]|uniref:YveK family protein n=1 Tax=Streptococcus suis TaxID=1307 RepID=UPI002117AADE|nr:Wzz/FepE/Etk N-terminal domain-containing protein [Streptococcus suis]
MDKKTDDIMNIFELIKLLKKNFIMIITCALFGGFVMGMYANFAVKPQYDSSAQLLVAQDPIDIGSGNTYVQAANSIRTNLEMIPTYRDILYGVPVLGKVSETFDGKYSATDLKARLSFVQTEDSQAFVVKLRMDDAKEAQVVLEEITTIFSQTLQEIYSQGFGKVVVLSPASFNSNKVSPSIVKNIVSGILAGVFISFGFILSRNILDNTVKNDSLLQSYDLTLLTELYNMSTKDISDAHYK